MQIMKLLSNIVVFTLLVPSAAYADPGTQDYVVIVLDRSCSMVEEFGTTSRMRAAQQALKAVIGGAPQTTQLGIYVFPARDGWIQQLGPRNNEKLFHRIDGITPDGGTPLGSSIKVGADALLAARAQHLGYGSYRLVVITDGAADPGSETDAMHRYAREALQRGLTLNAIGVGMVQGHALQHLAHAYAPANDPDALTREAKKMVLAEVSDADLQASGNDFFESIQGFDPGLAQQVIDTLATFQNHPLGTEPPRPQDTSDQRGGGGPAIAGQSPQLRKVDCACQASHGKPREQTLFGSLLVLAVVLTLLVGRRHPR